jgi:hypothetical protein
MKKMMMKKMINDPEYLVRARDYHIFKFNESEKKYRSYFDNGELDNNFLTEDLIKIYGFFAIEKEDISKYEELNKLYNKIIEKYNESDGNGGIKGMDYLSDGEREFIGL